MGAQRGTTHKCKYKSAGRGGRYRISRKGDSGRTSNNATPPAAHSHARPRLGGEANLYPGALLTLGSWGGWPRWTRAQGMASAWHGVSMAWHRHGMASAWHGVGMAWGRHGMASAWHGFGMAWRRYGMGSAWHGVSMAWRRHGMAPPPCMQVRRRGWHRHHACKYVEGGTATMHA